MTDKLSYSPDLMSMPGYQNDRRGSLPNHSPTAEVLSRFLLQIVDYGLGAVVLVVPLLLGARQSWGKLVFVSLCGLISIAWFSRQSLLGRGYWIRSRAFLIIPAALIVVSLQIIPLPKSVVVLFAPQLSNLLPLWENDSPYAASLGGWQTLSVSPSDTKIALAMVIAYGLLFVTAVQRLRSTRDVAQLMRCIALSSVAMAAFGLIQYFLSNGLFFWFYEYAFTDTRLHVKGGFTSRNHFANFLVLGIGPLIAWLTLQYRQPNRSNATPESTRTFESTAVSESEGRRRLGSHLSLAVAAGLTLVICSVLLTLSRGGIIAAGTAVLISAIIFSRLRLISGAQLIGTAAIGSTVLLFLSFHGYDQFADRMVQLKSTIEDDFDSDGGRRKVWEANLAAIRSHWRFGSGAGTHRHICPVYLSNSSKLEFTHAESGYLQIVTENGVPGFLLLVIGITTCFVWCCSTLRVRDHATEKILVAAVSASLAASAVHAIVDFAWYIPACMATTLLLAACALRLAQLTSPVVKPPTHELHFGREFWIPAATCATLAGVAGFAILIGPAHASLEWNRYLLASTAKTKANLQILKHPRQDRAFHAEISATLNEAMTHSLERVVKLYPDFGRAHQRLAQRYITEFEKRQIDSHNAMSIAQIRDAAIASEFASAKALRDWLSTAFGDSFHLLYRAHFHAWRAVQISPLEGEAYLTLANLSFLEGRGREEIVAFIDQALRVRPRDGGVVFDAGRHLMLLGDLEHALKLWRRIFADSGKHQLQIVDVMTSHMSAAQFLRLFRPDWRTLHQIARCYESKVKDFAVVVEYACARADKDTAEVSFETAAKIWLRLAQLHEKLHRHDAMFRSLQRGHATDPHNFNLRHYYGTRLLHFGRSKEAAGHLRWCLAQEPSNANIQAQLKRALSPRMPQKHFSHSLN